MSPRRCATSAPEQQDCQNNCLEWIRFRVAPGNLVFPSGIALHLANGNIYWTDEGTGKIQRANLDGSNLEDLITGLTDPRGIALDLRDPDPAEGTMYWTDWGTDEILRANLDGPNIQPIVTSGLQGPHGIALDLRDPDR